MKEKKPTTKRRKNARAVVLFIISLFFVGIAVAIGVIGSSYMENQNFKETFYSVSSLKVNNKIRVIQISDLHNCTYGKDNKDLVKRIKKLKPDLIIYTGDCVDSESKSIDVVINLCKDLAAVAPSYYIYGNNEVEKVYDYPLTQKSLDKKFNFNDKNREPEKLLELEDSFAKKLEQAGVKVLKNSMETITVGSTKVDVYGVLTSNPSSFWSYAGESFDGYLYSNENNLKITAIHEPLVLEEYTPESWGDVVLAGHTHGGTARIPMLGPVYTPDGGILPERSGHLVYGRYEVQGRPLIVSSGLENNNVLRVNNQPEIVIVDINKF